MFFRRVFSRKEPTTNGRYPQEEIETLPIPPSPHRNRLVRRISSEEKRGLAVLQLTPLWEHIIRTKSLPTNVNEPEMFEEFLERLRDPEWQVRQHALRVLVDVLIVMKQSADQFFAPLIRQLVENLGHAAPAIRKGALDVLKVYMSETAMPETVLLEIIDLGLEQKLNDAIFGRLCVGVMLSLPSLIQPTLGTSKREYVLKSTIDALTRKMVQVTYQEVALKVLLRIREMVGAREFSEHIAHGAYREFEMLCNVYGLPRSEDATDAGNDLYISTSAGGNRTWQVLTTGNEQQMSNKGNKNTNNSKVRPTELYWKSTTDEDDDDNDDEDGNKVRPSLYQCDDDEKVIMETEINIDNTPVTMRILEQKDSHMIPYDDDSGDEEELVGPVYEHSGIVRVLTDSELEEINNGLNAVDMRRTPRRVTFGGEIVKMRTPDSDSVTQSDGDDRRRSSNQSLAAAKQSLLIDIPNDNTMPRTLPSSPSRVSSAIGSKTNENSILTSPIDRPKSALTTSPNAVKRMRRLSNSPMDDIISSTPPHKQIEVLHNLQRSPSISPTRLSRRNSSSDKIDSTEQDAEPVITRLDEVEELKINATGQDQQSWEELGLVSDEVIKSLRSGDWKNRSNAICTVEDTVKSTENLALIQTCLESFLKMLLSSEKHPEVLEDKRRILINLISRLPLENLEKRAAQITVGLCRQGGAGSNRVAKALMQRLLPTAVAHRLISEDFLNGRSSRFRENALQMVLYALMTFPSTYFDIGFCVGHATKTATDRKRRVRQAALDVLAVLGQISSTKIVMDIVQQLAYGRDDGQHLCAAVKARLSRKQLPIVSVDGNVQYALRIPSFDSSTSSYLFGADIEWITAGSGSVSPTSLKKRSQRVHMAGGLFHESDDMNRNRADDSSKRHKAPHEILAVGVGVKPAYEHHPHHYTSKNNFTTNVTASENLNGSTKTSPFSNIVADNDKNTHFIIATAIPSHVPQQLINGSGAGMKQSKMQSRSFPELSEATSVQKHQMRPFHNGNKPSRLPVTSRFPAMESHSDGKSENLYNQRNYHSNNDHNQQHQLIHSYNPSTMQNIAQQNRLNSSLPRNLHTTTNIPIRNGHALHYSQESLTNQSSADEYRPATHPALTSAGQRRFVNVEKYLNGKTTNIDHQKQQNEQQTTTTLITKVANDIERNNNNYKDSPVSYRSNDNISRQSNYETKPSTIVGDSSDVSATGTTSEYSTEDQSTSGTSTPTRRIVDGASGDHINRNKNLPSRPVSVLSTATTKSLKDDDLIQRPKTAASLVRSSTASSINNSIRSGAVSGSVGSISNFGSSRRQSIVDANANYKSDDAISDVENLNDEQPPPSNVTEDEDHDIDDDDRQPDAQSIKSTDTSGGTPAFSEYPDENDHTEQNTIPTTSPFVRKRNRPPVLLRNRKVSPTKPAVSQLSHGGSKQKPNAELFPSNLSRFDRPREAQTTCLNQLDSNNWEETMIGLQSLVRLVRHHSDHIEPQIHLLCVALGKNIKNLRSQVSRASCQAAAEFFETKAKLMEPEADDLALSLLNRTADTNKFLRSDATHALESMCDNLPAPKAIHILTTRGTTHQNAIVRTASAKLCSRIVERMGSDRVFALNRDLRDRIIVTGANLLMEGSLETRNHAKMMFKQLSDHSNYNKTLLEVIPARTFRNIEKTLRSIR